MPAVAPEPPPAEGGRRVVPGALGMVVTIYPFALPGLILLAGRRMRRSTTDAAWLVAVMLFAALSLVHGRLDANLLGVVLAWGVHKSVRAHQAPDDVVRHVERGVAIGVIGLALVAGLEAAVLGEARASTAPWFGHPNAFAHALLVLGVGAGLAVRGWLGFVVLLAALAGMVATGSRSGMIAATVALVAALAMRRTRLRALVALAGGSATVLLAILLAPGAPWAQRLLPNLALAPGREQVNLFAASEALGNPAAWSQSGVVTTRGSGEAQEGAVWSIVRDAPVAWARPQQAVDLQPGIPYTLSAEFRATGEGTPGFLAWGESEDGVVELRVVLADGAAEVLSARGLSDARTDAEFLPGGWTRLDVTFEVAPREGPLAVSIGPSPDPTSTVSGERADVRFLQLERGRERSDYQPTYRVRTGTGEALSRLPIWRTAVAGILERPWIGHGSGAFASHYVAHGPPGLTPGHEHSQVLSSLFEGGLLGLAAFASVLLALGTTATPSARFVLLALVTANLVDSTFFLGTVLFPMAALAGLTKTA